MLAFHLHSHFLIVMMKGIVMMMIKVVVMMIRVVSIPSSSSSANVNIFLLTVSVNGKSTCVDL